MGFGILVMKKFLHVWNVIFMLVGLIVLGVGIALKSKISAIENIAKNVSVVSMLIMVVGVVVFLVAVFGYYGTIKESNNMLITYAIFMMTLMALKIALTTFIFVNLGRMLEEIPRILTRSFFGKPAHLFKAVEDKFQCCGIYGPQDYHANTLYLPKTCCAYPPCYDYEYDRGCTGAVTAFATTFAAVIAFYVIVVAALEFMTSVFALCFRNAVIRNKEGQQEREKDMKTKL